LSITGTHFLRNLLIAPLWMIMNREDDAYTHRQGLSGGMRSDELAELLFLCFGQFYRITWLGTSHGLFLPS
jgi:hypothetical protein